MPPKPALREAITNALKNSGPMTFAQISAEIGRTKTAVRDCIYGARMDHGTKYFRVAQWRPRITIDVGPDGDASKYADRKPGDETLAASIQRCIQRPANPFSGLGGVL